MNTVLIIIVVVLVLFLMGKKLHKQGFFRKKESNGTVKCSCKSDTKPIEISGELGPMGELVEVLELLQSKVPEKEDESQPLEASPIPGESFSYFTPNSLLPKATDIPVLKEEIKISPLLHQKKKKSGRKKKVVKNAKANVL